MQGKRIASSAFAGVAIASGIFGLVADAPDFVAFLAMSATWHSLLIVGGVGALVWINRDWLKANVPWLATWLPPSQAPTHDARAQRAGALAPETRRALCVALDVQINILMMLRIDAVLRASPSLNANAADERSMAEYSSRAQRFLDSVSRRLSDTAVSIDLNSVVLQAKNAGRAQVRSIPRSELPADVDPYILQTFCETQYAFEAMTEFLMHRRGEFEQNLANYTDALKEQFRVLSNTD